MFFFLKSYLFLFSPTFMFLVVSHPYIVAKVVLCDMCFSFVVFFSGRITTFDDEKNVHI